MIEWRDFQTLIDAIGAVRGEDGEEHTAARHSLTDVWHSMTETMKKDVNDKVRRRGSEAPSRFSGTHDLRLVGVALWESALVLKHSFMATERSG